MIDNYADMVNTAVSALDTDRGHLNRSAEYYDATYRLEAIGVAVPDEMRKLNASIGWPRMYVDSIEERLDLEGFRLADNDEIIEKVTDWWKANQLDEESGLAHVDALVYGRSYVTVGAPGPNDEPGVPVIRVESPLDMHVETDPRTREVTRAVRIYKNRDNEGEKWATLYLPNETIFLKEFGGEWVVDPKMPKVVHNLGQVPVIPILNRERLSDRYGNSEITPEIRSFTDAASRIMMDMQAAAELMAVPQRVLFGVDAASLAPNGTPEEVLHAYMSQILAIPDENGKAQQFSAAELRNFVDVLEELAKHVASYTGLPPQYLSFTTENPASAEAIRSAETRLVKKCERKARMFGGSWERVMKLALKVMKIEVEGISRLEAHWRNPATPTYAAMADGVVKLYSNGQGIITKKRAREDMGYTAEEISKMEEDEVGEQRAMVKLSEVMAASQAKATGAVGGSAPAGNGTRARTTSSTTRKTSSSRKAA